MKILEGNYQRNIIIRALLLALILSGVCLIVFPNPKEYIYGLAFGTSINVLNFKLMAITMEKAVHMPQSRIKKYVMGNYSVRYIIYGIMLSISAVADYINFFAAVVGILMVKIVILSAAFYDIILDALHKKTK
ncbi:ATP synthase subunit I [Proteiniborus sp. MB09-C3]|uniref:ATP synthase subunit I n=1 Tax=Proteiniborus sp. MB09-C3 TaxID=3050072 RepID=UPI00255403FB|nr:ATP synthase subunit I [Proteiniborus sp. MB09-C3]WIV12184.1 ATP synthase subunit I [Proteiniborus sp. MB09-C3]